MWLQKIKEKNPPSEKIHFASRCQSASPRRLAGRRHGWGAAVEFSVHPFLPSFLPPPIIFGWVIRFWLWCRLLNEVSSLTAAAEKRDFKHPLETLGAFSVVIQCHWAAASSLHKETRPASTHFWLMMVVMIIIINCCFEAAVYICLEVLPRAVSCVHDEWSCIKGEERFSSPALFSFYFVWHWQHQHPCWTPLSWPGWPSSQGGNNYI